MTVTRLNRYRYSLRWLMIVVGIAFLFLALVRLAAIESNRVAKHVERLGGTVTYSSQLWGGELHELADVPWADRLMSHDRNIVKVSFVEGTSQLTDREFPTVAKELGQLPLLDRVNLFNIPLSDDSVVHFRHLSHVEVIYIFRAHNTSISDRGIHRIRKLCPRSHFNTHPVSRGE